MNEFHYVYILESINDAERRARKERPLRFFAYPQWDGSESIAEYAKRTSLPATKTLELGNGVRIELVLIPAGTFKMGTPEPPPVDEERYRSKILTGRVVLWIGGGVLLVLLGVVRQEQQGRDTSGRTEDTQRLGRARHARQRLGVVRGPVRGIQVQPRG